MTGDPAFFETRADGYERWRDYDPEGPRRAVYVHQLVAIANGADPERVFSGGAFQIHHRDGVHWHNVQSNLELVDAREHGRRHGSGGDGQ